MSDWHGDQALSGAIAGFGFLPRPCGIVVGLRAEARLLGPLRGVVAIGGGGAAGAARAAAGLEGVGALLSVGLAGGLDPALAPGAVLVPEAVLTGGRRLATSLRLCHALGGATAGALLGGEAVVAGVAEKARLHAETGAVAVDLESGAVVEAALARGLPFAALRVVCDPAGRDLPPAALAALDAAGAIGLLRVLRSVLRRPAQVPGLLALARDAAAARAALRGRVRTVGALPRL